MRDPRKSSHEDSRPDKFLEKKKKSLDDQVIVVADIFTGLVGVHVVVLNKKVFLDVLSK